MDLIHLSALHIGLFVSDKSDLQIGLPCRPTNFSADMSGQFAGQTCRRQIGRNEQRLMQWLQLRFDFDSTSVFRPFDTAYQRSHWTQQRNSLAAVTLTYLFIMPPPHRAEALSDAFFLRLSVCLSVCLTVCLSRTSGLTRERRGLGRIKLAQLDTVDTHVTRTSLSRSEGQRSTCLMGKIGIACAHILLCFALL